MARIRGVESLHARVNHALGYGETGPSKGGVCALPATASEPAAA